MLGQFRNVCSQRSADDDSPARIQRPERGGLGQMTRTPEIEVSLVAYGASGTFGQTTVTSYTPVRGAREWTALTDLPRWSQGCHQRQLGLLQG